MGRDVSTPAGDRRDRLRIDLDPAPGKSPIGGPYPHAYGGNVGYNSYDRFDLGDHPQRGHWETRYGSRTSLRNLVRQRPPDWISKSIPTSFSTTPATARTSAPIPEWSRRISTVGTMPANPAASSARRACIIWDAEQWHGRHAPPGTRQPHGHRPRVRRPLPRRRLASADYAPDPTPFVRHPGEHEKYPYHNRRPASERELPRLCHPLDQLARLRDGLRRRSPRCAEARRARNISACRIRTSRHRDKTLIYNIQKNFNERRGSHRHRSVRRHVYQLYPPR